MDATTPHAEPRPSRVRYVVLAWLCAAAMIAYVARNSISAAESSIRTSLNLTEWEMGIALGAFFLPYALLQVPTGWLSHIWGSRLALPLFSLLGSVMTGVFAWAGGFYTLTIGRFGMGVAQAGLFPAATSTMAKWFPATQRGMASGLLTSFMSIGGAVGTAVTGYLLQWTSWHIIFSLFTGLGIIWAGWFFFWFRDSPDEHAAVNSAEQAIIRGAAPEPAGAPEPTPWLSILTSAALFWICFQQFFRAAGYNFFATWFATYLQETRGVSEAQAGIMNSMPLLGVVVGSYLGGFISDRLLSATGSRRMSRQAVAVFGHIFCAILILVGYRVQDPWPAVFVISLSACIGAFGAPCSYAITMDMGGRHVAPVFGLMNMSGNLGAWLFPMVVPLLLGTPKNWDMVMLLFAGIYAAAALCWIPFNANGTIVKERPGLHR